MSDIRVVVMKEPCGYDDKDKQAYAWVAQALEQDMAAQASATDGPDDAVEALGDLFTARQKMVEHILLTEGETVRGLPEAPPEYHAMWDEGEPVERVKLGQYHYALVRRYHGRGYFERSGDGFKV